MCANICVEQNAMHFFGKKKKKELPETVASFDDLPVFASNLLNEYQEKEKLTWHDQTIPDDEI